MRSVFYDYFQAGLDNDRDLPRPGNDSKDRSRLSGYQSQARPSASNQRGTVRSLCE